MAYTRKIIQEKHATLRRRAKRVELHELQDPMFQQLIDDMFATMYAAPGIGLAAPQINVSKRLFTVDLQEEDGVGPFVMINPRFTLREGAVESTEGCLSVVEFIGDITRHEHVICVGLDRYGGRQTIEGTGLLARCLQHEMDHLDGVLYIDSARDIRPADADDEPDQERLHEASAPADHAQSASAR